MSIRRLPSFLISRIAAGEVIERPASVVKELVENALDAEATSVELQIEEGGIKRIMIRDNGKGMRGQDIPLALERHATSKLPSDDLLDIHSFGFRGEALPAIASVSRLTLTSRCQEEDHGWQVSVYGGEEHPPQPVSAPLGTQIDVRDLFYATPARLKFLKSTTTEQQHILDVVERAALAYPQVSFLLSSEKRILFRSPGASDVLPRLDAVLGPDFSKNSLKVDLERDAYRLKGYISLPTYHQGTGQAQYFFVNGRPVKDKQLFGAVRAAYQDVLSHDRYPALVLYLTLPPQEVDVNVHPAKAEVRFREAQRIRGMIVSGLKSILMDAALAVSSQLGHQIASQILPNAIPVDQSPSTPVSSWRSSGNRSASGHSYMNVQSSFLNTHPDAFRETQPAITTHHPGFGEEILREAGEEDLFPLGRVKAQLHHKYVLAQTKDGIVLVDQHAAHERIIYERLKVQLAQEGIQRDVLLIPEVITLSPRQTMMLSQKFDLLAQSGLIMELFGEGAVLLREVPTLLSSKVQWAPFIQEIADEILEQDDSTLVLTRILERCSTYACHHSIRTGRSLSPEEMDQLLRQMETTPLASQCNHGRPTHIHLSLDQLDKLFGRH